MFKSDNNTFQMNCERRDEDAGKFPNLLPVSPREMQPRNLNEFVVELNIKEDRSTVRPSVCLPGDAIGNCTAEDIRQMPETNYRTEKNVLYSPSEEQCSAVTSRSLWSLTYPVGWVGWPASQQASFNYMWPKLKLKHLHYILTALLANYSATGGGGKRRGTDAFRFVPCIISVSPLWLPSSSSSFSAAVFCCSSSLDWTGLDGVQWDTTI